MSGVRSSLSRFAHLGREPDADEGWRVAKAAWHTHGLLLVNPAEAEKRHGWVAGREAKNLGEKLYGKREDR